MLQRTSTRPPAPPLPLDHAGEHGPEMPHRPTPVSTRCERRRRTARALTILDALSKVKHCLARKGQRAYAPTTRHAHGSNPDDLAVGPVLWCLDCGLPRLDRVEVTIRPDAARL